MESSGSVFVDARRTDVIEYCFRNKGDLLGDLKKARHCLDAAIEVLSANASDQATEGVAKRSDEAKKQSNSK